MLFITIISFFFTARIYGQPYIQDQLCSSCHHVLPSSYRSLSLHIPHLRLHLQTDSMGGCHLHVFRLPFCHVARDGLADDMVHIFHEDSVKRPPTGGQHVRKSAPKRTQE